MDSDSEKENYFSLYMKRKNNKNKKKANNCSDKKAKNNCAFIQKSKDNKSKNIKISLEPSDKKIINELSLTKSYLFNFQNQEKNKKDSSRGIKNMTIEKNKLKNIRINKSSADIRSIMKTNKKIINNKYKDFGYKVNDAGINNNHYDNKIDKLKNRIYDLMNVIDNFENDYIKNNKELEIKNQLSKINIHLFGTDRVNYNRYKKLNNNNNYIKLNEDLDICNYYDYDYDNKVLTKRENSNKNKQRPISSKIPNEKKLVEMLNYNLNDNNNSVFMKLINSNSKKELKNTNYNVNKLKGKNSNVSSLSNKSSIKNKNDKNDKKKKQSSIFKRRINYSNFINQKKKQNIILRNQELCFKQNKINKSNNSNGCNKMKIGLDNNNYCNIYCSKENNYKIKSLDKSAKKINNLNFMINKNINHRNNKKNEFYDNFQNDEFYKNYFLSENREYAHLDNK